MAEATYIMTYRDGDGPARRDNLLAVLRWLSRYPMFDVVVVEQDSVPRLTGPLPHPRCTHVFAYNPGPFNKNWGYNVGFRHANHAILAFGDADVIVGDAIAESIAYLKTGYSTVKPYKRLFDLTEDESRRVIEADLDYVPERSASLPGREGIGEFLVFAGGVFLITRAAFVHVGGWDERFRGWGGEDDAMSYKLERARVSGVELDSRGAIHLHHERVNTSSADASTKAQPHYAANIALLADYRRLESEEMQRFAEIQMQVIGRREKYQPQ
jgi:hypothetical protein